MGSHADREPILKGNDKARAASFSLSGTTTEPQTALPHNHMQAPQAGSSGHPQGRPVAQPIYANHPLDPIATAIPSTVTVTGWNQGMQSSSTHGGSGQGQLNGGIPAPQRAPQFTNPFADPRMPPAGMTSQTLQMQPGKSAPMPPYTAMQMRVTGSEQGSSSSGNMGRNPGYGPLAGVPVGYDFGYKKRACDQCNHSKVRCDFADPCSEFRSYLIHPCSPCQIKGWSS